MQSDPHPGKLKNPITFNSKYIYTNNNPVNLIDPGGEFAFLATVVIASVISGAVATSVEYAKTGQWNWNTFGKVAAITAVLMTSSYVGAYAGTSTASAAEMTGTTGGTIIGTFAGAGAGALTGGIVYGAYSDATGGSFSEGFKSGAWLGGISGGIAAGLFTCLEAGGAVSIGGSTYDVGSAAILLNTINSKFLLYQLTPASSEDRRAARDAAWAAGIQGGIMAF